MLAHRMTARVAMVLGSTATLLGAGIAGFILGGWGVATPLGASAAALSVTAYRRLAKWLLDAGGDWY